MAGLWEILAAVVAIIFIVVLIHCCNKHVQGEGQHNTDEETDQETENKVLTFEHEDEVINYLLDNWKNEKDGEYEDEVIVEDEEDGALTPVIQPEGREISSHNSFMLTNQKKAMERAKKEGGTLLWTNLQKAYISDRRTHAEIQFIDETKQPNGVHKIYITNSPCRNCSPRLIKFFDNYSKKPTIFVGQIWRPNDSDKENSEGLKKMMEEGFDFKVWEQLHDKCYPDKKLKNILIN